VKTARVVLAGDIGGTRARFALFRCLGAKLGRRVDRITLDSKAFPTFERALETCLARWPDANVTTATFGIAGPVVDQTVRTTNLPWHISARSLSRKFGIANVTLLNDLVATGYGAMGSPSRYVRTIRNGRPKKEGATVAVIAAGTGLGEAVFVWDGTRHIPCATEGSHVDFAPRTSIESALLRTLTAVHGHVSYERVASGSTLAMLYDFFVHEQRVHVSRAETDALSRALDRNGAVVELALAGQSEASMRAVELWCSVYGAEAGNLALKSLAVGGVYVCGGVSATLAEVLIGGLPSRSERTSPFTEAFLDKGRMRGLLERVPIALVTDPDVGLVGAALHAAQQAGYE
jgi:glucokinase